MLGSRCGYVLELPNARCRSCGVVDFLFDGLCRMCHDAQGFDPVEALFVLEGVRPRVACPLCRLVAGLDRP